MVSSGGDSGGDYGMGGVSRYGGAEPMPNLPVAGSDGAVVDPFNYGKFQNFLPDIKAEGPNDAATGLRPEMFIYKGPNGQVDSSGGSGGGGNDMQAQIQTLRDQLAKLQSNQGRGGMIDPASGAPISTGWSEHPFARQLATEVGGGG